MGFVEEGEAAAKTPGEVVDLIQEPGKFDCEKNLKIRVAVHSVWPESSCSVRRLAVPAEMTPAIPKSFVCLFVCLFTDSGSRS